jgi:hypothetical protein
LYIHFNNTLYNKNLSYFLDYNMSWLFELAIKLVTFISCSNEKTILSIKDYKNQDFKFMSAVNNGNKTNGNRYNSVFPISCNFFYCQLKQLLLLTR